MEAVRVWEEPVVIPTYEVGAPDRNPMFIEKRVYQGSTGKIYPYPATQEISREKTNHVWNAVYLENQYIKVMVLPELGGRIQRAYDKTNDYDFVYYNQVIKPALVGLTGPWISGGIEFNWPQHHRPTTYSPVDHEIRDNGDGSMSLLIHDADQMYGTSEVTAFTLYPDRAYIEIRGQLYNGTPLPQTFLWWANPAVAVNDHTQSIFPPDVHSVYDHGKRAVSRFPIATGEYYKHDYSEGVDISRYKNVPVPTSYMAEPSEYNFVGGYDYQKKAGLLHVADHHVSPGKKQWTWGNGDFGYAWDRNLTDEDGPYIELMTGMYCENQPDFTWLKPFEEKTFYQYFMPYKAVGQVKNATINAVLGTELKDGVLHVCVYGTRLYEEAEVVVSYRGEEVYREKTKLSPVDIYEMDLALKLEDEYEVRVAVVNGGRELVSYQAKNQGIPELAEPAKAPATPQEMLTNEELFLTAQHIEQYRHATWLPDPYYLEGLKRDPGDTRINNAYGLLLLRRGCFAESEPYFRTAIRRLTGDGTYNNPYDGEAFYNLGLSLFYQERYDEAFDAFYKATWTNEQQEMAFYYLAAIASRRGDFEEALALVEKGLVKNAHNVKARGLKALVLRELGRREAALAWIEENLAVDPFDFVSLFVRAEIGGMDAAELDAFHSLTRDFHETFLSAARSFAEAGFYEDALAVLKEYPGDKPMVHYYRALYLKALGGAGPCRRELEAAEKSPSLYCFPNKLEDIAALENGIAENPSGPKAYYYLGCLFYDKLQFERSIELWEKSEALDDSFPTLLRNLATAYYNKRQDPEQALERMERAFALDTTDARVFLELDQLHKKLGYSAERRLADFEKHIGLIEKRDDLYTEYVTVLNLAGQYEKAHEMTVSHDFQTWEGAEGKITTQFKVSLLEMAKGLLAEADADGDTGSTAFVAADVDAAATAGSGPCGRKETLLRRAEAMVREALSYPHNLGEGHLEGTKDNHLWYTLGLILERLGNAEEARECYERATEGAMEVAGMMYYYDQPADMILYQGRAKEKLGDRKAANARFYRLIDFGEHHIRDSFKMDYFAVSMPDFMIFDEDMNKKNEAHCRYVMGLGKLGLGRRAGAAEDFRKVLEIDGSHQNAMIYLKMAEEA